MHKLFPLCIVFLLLGSCNSDDATKVTSVDDNKNVAVIPVTDFLKGQLKQIENSPVTPLKISSNLYQTDSLWITRDSIRPFINPFLIPEIDSASMTPYFNGTSFLDQTINAFTLTYEANAHKPSNIDLKQMDIYIDPVKHTIKKVYLVKEIRIQDTTRIWQMTWTTDVSCSIRSIVQFRGEEPLITEEKILWSFD